MDTEVTYTLSDLEALEFPGTPLAVLGQPVQHSISPAMQNAALARLAEQHSRFKDWAYYRFEVSPDDLLEALPRFHAKSFLGLNLTVPHKVVALDAVKGVSPDAERMGAVNTLVWDEFGYDGFNTDGFGLERGLAADLGVSLEGAHVILLGSGGAARAAAVQCVAGGCAALYVGNRSVERLAGLVAVIREMQAGDRVHAFSWGELPADLPETGVVVNATSLGLKLDDPAPIDVGRLPKGWNVYDMIYNPAETQLLREARERGMATANGLSMLVYQGLRSLEIWSHVKPDDRTMMAAATRALDRPPRF